MANVRLLQSVRIAGTSLLSLLSKPLPMLINALSEVIFLEKEMILGQGEATDHPGSTCLYIIKSGRASVHKDGEQVAVLKDGDFFGEMGLVNEEPRSASIVSASTTLSCLTLSKAAFGLLTTKQALDGLKAVADRRKKANLQRDLDNEASDASSPRSSNTQSRATSPALGDVSGPAPQTEADARTQREDAQLDEEDDARLSSADGDAQSREPGAAPGESSTAAATSGGQMRQLDRYRLMSTHRATSLSQRPASVPSRRMRFPLGNMGFRGLAQLLLDQGVHSVDLWSATTKHELFEVARRHRIDLSRLRRQEMEQLETELAMWQSHMRSIARTEASVAQRSRSTPAARSRQLRHAMSVPRAIEGETNPMPMRATHRGTRLA